MTFREAFLIACDQNPKATVGHKRRIARARKADPRNKRVARRWARMEERAVKRYKAETGQTVTDFGDGQFLQWLIDNLPSILKLMMSILAVFGL